MNAVRLDALAMRLCCPDGPVPPRCSVCGRHSLMRVAYGTLRETVVCSCGSFRQRQVAEVILSLWPAGSLRELASRHDIAVCNTEAARAVHDALVTMRGYITSEYLGPLHRPGATVNGARHEDLRRLSYADSSFDLVLTSDVLEHVPGPYAAHAEIRRVLRPPAATCSPFRITHISPTTCSVRASATTEPSSTCSSPSTIDLQSAAFLRAIEPLIYAGAEEEQTAPRAPGRRLGRLRWRGVHRVGPRSRRRSAVPHPRAVAAMGGDRLRLPCPVGRRVGGRRPRRQSVGVPRAVRDRGRAARPG